MMFMMTFLVAYLSVATSMDSLESLKGFGSLTFEEPKCKKCSRIVFPGIEICQSCKEPSDPALAVTINPATVLQKQTCHMGLVGRTTTDYLRKDLVATAEASQTYSTYCTFLTNLVSILSEYQRKFDVCMTAYKDYDAKKDKQGTVYKAEMKAAFDQKVEEQGLIPYMSSVNAITIRMWTELEPLVETEKQRETSGKTAWYKVGKILLVMCKISVKVMAMNVDGMFNWDELEKAMQGLSDDDDFQPSQWFKETLDVGEDFNTLIQETTGKGMLERAHDAWIKFITKSAFLELKNCQKTLENLTALVEKLTGYSQRVRADPNIPDEITNAMNVFKYLVENDERLPKYHCDVVVAQVRAIHDAVTRNMEKTGENERLIYEHANKMSTLEATIEELKNQIAQLRQPAPRRSGVKLDGGESADVEDKNTMDQTRRRLNVMNRLLKMSTSTAGSEKRRRP